MRKLTVSLAAAALIAAGAFPVIALSAPREQPATTAASTTRAALDDATIVAIFDAANTADVEVGELAAQRGSSKEVRDMGTMFARDHRMVRQQGRDLAKKLGVTPTPPRLDTRCSTSPSRSRLVRCERTALSVRPRAVAI